MATKKGRRGQSSLEFLYATLFSLLFLVLAIFIFVESGEDAGVLAAASDAGMVCNAVSIQLSKIASAGEGAEAAVEFPEKLAGNYSVWVSGSNKSLAVAYAGGGVGCRFLAQGVGNGTSDEFYIAEGAVMRNNGTGVVIG